MNNTNKKVEMLRQKAALEKKIKAFESAKAAKKAKLVEARRNSLSYLIESEMDKAAVVMAAQGIVEKLGKMAEDLAKIEGDDLMPLMDSLKTAFGPQMAESFQKVVSDHVRQAVSSITTTKDGISSEVGKLEGVVEGEPGNDMAAMGDEPAAPPAPPVDDAADAAAPTDDLGAGDDVGADAGADADLGDTDMSDLDDLFADDDTSGPAGRARKESASPRGRKIREGKRARRSLISESVMDAFKDAFAPHMSEIDASASPRDRLVALKPFIVAQDYEIASALPDYVLQEIFDKIDDASAEASAMVPAPIAPVSVTVPSVTPPAPVAAPAPAVDVDPIGAGAGLGDDATLGDELGDLDGGVEEDDLLDGPEMFESVSDARVLSLFRRNIREGRAPAIVARALAQRFGIDLADVVSIVKEAKKEGGHVPGFDSKSKAAKAGVKACFPAAKDGKDFWTYQEDGRWYFTDNKKEFERKTAKTEGARGK